MGRKRNVYEIKCAEVSLHLFKKRRRFVFKNYGMCGVQCPFNHVSVISSIENCMGENERNLLVIGNQIVSLLMTCGPTQARLPY